MDYEIVQQGRLFTTKGLVALIGFELEVELDDLTAKRAGEKAARPIFNLLLQMVNEIELKEGTLIEGFDLHPNKPIRQVGEISTLSARKVRLVKKGQVIRLILSDVRGRWSV